ncbi:MAG TPA: hypothetical protein DE179_13370 [Oceanospirillaceae bacterium]|nr:hypothetical protein [Oceanospirillaceae bacterium]
MLEEGGESIWQEISALPDVLDVAGQGHEAEDHFGLLVVNEVLSPWEQRFEDVVVEMDRVEDALLILDGEDNPKQLSMLQRSLASLVSGFVRLGCLRLSLVAELSAAFVAARLADKRRAGEAKALDREDFLLLGKMLLIVRFRLADLSGKTVQDLSSELGSLEQKMDVLVNAGLEAHESAARRHGRVLNMAWRELQLLLGVAEDEEVSVRVSKSVLENLVDAAQAMSQPELVKSAQVALATSQTADSWHEAVEQLLQNFAAESAGAGHDLLH